MTQIPLSDLVPLILGYCAEEPRTMDEIHAEWGQHTSVIGLVCEDLVRTGRLVIAPHTNARRWTTPERREALTEDWQTCADIAWECGVSVTSARDALEKHRPMAARRTGRDGTVWWRLPVGEDPPIPDGSVGHRLAAYLRDTGGGTVSAIASAIGAEPRRLAGVAKRLRCAEIVDVGGVLWIVQAGREDVLPSSMLRALLSDGRPHTTQEAREATGLTGYPVYVALKEAGAVCDHLGRTWTLADGKRWAR